MLCIIFCSLYRVDIMSEPAAKRPSHSESYKGLFHSVFPGLVKELTEDGLSNPEIADGVKHLKEVLNFNVPNGMSLCNIEFVLYNEPLSGKCNRGLMVIGSLKHITAGKELTNEEETKALILGWCIEWVGMC